MVIIFGIGVAIIIMLWSLSARGTEWNPRMSGAMGRRRGVEKRSEQVATLAGRRCGARRGHAASISIVTNV
jgi:hypothetical protein